MIGGREAVVAKGLVVVVDRWQMVGGKGAVVASGRCKASGVGGCGWQAAKEVVVASDRCRASGS